MDSKKRNSIFIISIFFIFFVFASVAFFDVYYIVISAYKLPGGYNAEYVRGRLLSGLSLLPIINIPIVFAIIGFVLHFKGKEYAENLFYLLSCYFLNQLTFFWLTVVSRNGVSFNIGYIKIYSLIGLVVCTITHLLIIARQIMMLLPIKSAFTYKKIDSELLPNVHKKFIIRSEISYFKYYFPHLFGFFYISFAILVCGYFGTNWYSNLLTRADEYKYFIFDWLETIILAIPLIMLLFNKTFSKGKGHIGLKHTIGVDITSNKFVYEISPILFSSNEGSLLLISVNEIFEEHFKNKQILKKYLRSHSKEWIIVEKHK